MKAFAAIILMVVAMPVMAAKVWLTGEISSFNVNPAPQPSWINITRPLGTLVDGVPCEESDAGCFFQDVEPGPGEYCHNQFRGSRFDIAADQVSLLIHVSTLRESGEVAQFQVEGLGTLDAGQGFPKCTLVRIRDRK